MAAPGRDGAGERPIRILFVCLGNICRSPTAEGVMRALVAEAGLQDTVQLESAGTGSWHVGSPPDARAAQVARTRGMVLDGSARQVEPEDFERFDLLLAMDEENRRELLHIAPGEHERAKVRLLRAFDPASGGRQLDVPDPYYGADGGFEEVFDLVRAACEGLLEQITDGRAP